MAKNTKRRAFSINEKYLIINDIEAGTYSQAEVCLKMGISKSTISNMWKNRDKIRNDWHNYAKKKKVRSNLHPQVDQMLFQYYQETRAKNIPMDGNMVRRKAEEFGKLVGDEFKCSNGWLDRFKKRYNITFGKLNKTNTKDWIREVWPQLHAQYTAEDIFHVSEMGIFYRITPRETFHLKNEKCHGGILAKERVTVLVCVNVNGNDKRRLLIIGKYENPRCFKDVKKLPADYVANGKSWMTSIIFEEYLKKWDCELIRENRKILLLIDQSPGHSNISLHNIQIAFLPFNQTSILHSDMGIVWRLKQIFRKQLLLRFIEMQANHEDARISLLDAIYFLNSAWEKISTTTIRNCFRHAGLVKDLDEENSDSKADILGDDWFTINQLLNIDEFREFVNFDNGIVTTEDVKHEEQIKEEPEEETDDENDGKIDTVEALRCLRRIKSYFQKEAADDVIFSRLNGIQDFLENHYVQKTCVQAKIVEFLKN